MYSNPNKTGKDSTKSIPKYRRFLLLIWGSTVSYPSWIYFLFAGTANSFGKLVCIFEKHWPIKPILQHFCYSFPFTKMSHACRRVAKTENTLNFTLRNTMTNNLVRIVFEVLNSLDSSRKQSLTCEKNRSFSYFV